MRDLLWEEISQPKPVGRGMDPCFERVAVEAVYRDDSTIYGFNDEIQRDSVSSRSDLIKENHVLDVRCITVT